MSRHTQPLFQFRASPQRMFASVVGPVFLGLGQGISVSAGFGSFGFSVFLDGLYQTFAMPLWVSQFVMTLCFYVIAWKWGRIQLGMGSLPTLLLIGPSISIAAALTPADLHFFGNLFAFVSGLLIFAFGISLSAAAALGPDGVTALSLAAEKQLNWSVPTATFIWGLLAISVGAGLGGNIGIASPAGLFCVPIVIHWMLPHLRHAIDSPSSILATKG